MSSNQLKRIRRLTQRDETWLCCARRAYLWIAPEDDGSPSVLEKTARDL